MSLVLDSPFLKGMDQIILGALPPNPRGLSLFGLMDGVKKEKAKLSRSASPSTSHLHRRSGRSSALPYPPCKQWKVAIKIVFGKHGVILSPSCF